LRNKDGTTTYRINDVYQFGFKKNDRQARHGFPLGDISATTMTLIKDLLPAAEYWNPGGFKERWEIKKTRREYILFIPQQFLAGHGKPFPVEGSFTR
jgi:hypothetical protein